jgi:hypothetical protein
VRQAPGSGPRRGTLGLVRGQEGIWRENSLPRRGTFAEQKGRREPAHRRRFCDLKPSKSSWRVLQWEEEDFARTWSCESARQRAADWGAEDPPMKRWSLSAH